MGKNHTDFESIVWLKIPKLKFWSAVVVSKQTTEDQTLRILSQTKPNRRLQSNLTIICQVNL